jgi:hypothetical protein
VTAATPGRPPEQVDLCTRPVFIIGSPRSGTSVLAWSLSRHTRLWTSGEVHLVYTLFGTPAFDRRFEKEGQLPGSWFGREGVGKEEFLRCIGLGLNALFSSRSGGKRWIEQTPVNTLMAHTLAEMFPGALFLHILRDGRRVVHSMIHFQNSLEEGEQAAMLKGGWYPPWARDFTEACDTWRASVEAAMEFSGRNPTRCLTVRHEALASDPERAFREVLRFLDVPHEDSPAKYFRSNRVHSSFRHGRTAGGDPPRAPAPWQVWTPVQKRVFIDVAGPAMVKYGLATRDELTLPVDVDYEGLVAHVRGLAGSALPPGSTVAVVSKGDPSLLDLPGARAWHMPQAEEGAYLGYHPSDSEEAIRHLEKLRARGAGYLLLPSTGFWWLEHYEGFRHHLEARYRRAWADPYCIIYSLNGEAPLTPPRPESTAAGS